MDLGKYIYQLLFENESVIIPGFGAFIASYKPAQIHDNQVTILPPSKEITFNPNLKNNDGLLVNYIAESEDISKIESLKMIEKFREDIQYRLEKGENIKFEGIGNLSLDENNNTLFVPDSSENFLLDSFGLGAAFLETEQETQELYVEIIPERENKKKPLWLLFLLIPVAAIAVFIYLSFLTPKEHDISQPESDTIKSKPMMTEEPLANSDSVQINLKVDTIKTLVEEPKRVEHKIFTGEKYYVIGGSFQEKENADKYLKKVEKMGYQPVDLGQQGNFFVVAVGLFASFDEAETVKNEYLEKEPNSGVYVIKISDK